MLLLILKYGQVKSRIRGYRSMPHQFLRDLSSEPFATHFLYWSVLTGTCNLLKIKSKRLGFVSEVLQFEL